LGVGGYYEIREERCEYLHIIINASLADKRKMINDQLGVGLFEDNFDNLG
jgi:hypothetical protein